MMNVLIDRGGVAAIVGNVKMFAKVNASLISIISETTDDSARLSPTAAATILDVADAFFNIYPVALLLPPKAIDAGVAGAKPPFPLSLLPHAMVSAKRYAGSLSHIVVRIAARHNNIDLIKNLRLFVDENGRRLIDKALRMYDRGENPWRAVRLPEGGAKVEAITSISITYYLAQRKKDGRTLVAYSTISPAHALALLDTVEKRGMEVPEPCLF